MPLPRCVGTAACGRAGGCAYSLAIPRAGVRTGMWGEGEPPLLHAWCRDRPSYGRCVCLYGQRCSIAAVTGTREGEHRGPSCALAGDRGPAGPRCARGWGRLWFPIGLSRCGGIAERPGMTRALSEMESHLKKKAFSVLSFQLRGEDLASLL